jgi:uncharacterized membrane protein
MVGEKAFLTEVSVSIQDPSRIGSDFTFESAPQDVEYRAVVYESVDVSGYALLNAYAVAVILALAVVSVLVRLRRRRA